VAEKKIAVIIGTKAQFIKTAPVLKELDKRNILYHLVYTGQHNETFDVLEKAFATREPDIVLVPNFEASTKSSFMSWSYKYWHSVLKQLRQGSWKGVKLGLVHGDTASTLFGAITLRLIGSQVAHIEAGLRSSKLSSPFPEEIIRRLVSKLSHIHFCPDAGSAANLHDISGKVVETQGNTLRDALALALSFDITSQHHAGSNYAVVSLHRNENLSNTNTLNMLMGEVVEASKTIRVKFVLHPTTREKLKKTQWQKILTDTENIQLLDRVDYPDFVKLLIQSSFLMTDGGSNQEEAAMLGLPTLLLRDTTERSDGLGGNIILSNLDPNIIQSFVLENAKKTWSLRTLNSGSPSAILVDQLEQELTE